MLMDSVTDTKVLRKLTLKSLPLDSIVPSWLCSCSQALQTLVIVDCTLQGLPSPAVGIPTCSSNIKQLTLGLDVTVAPGAALKESLQHQLRALSGLQSMHLIRKNHHHHDNFLGSFKDTCAVLSAVGLQLTHLCFSELEAVSFPAEFPVWFPCLIRLDLLYATLNDEDIEMLYKMPTIKHLMCDALQLESNYTDRPLSWTRLTMEQVCMEALSRVSLPALQHLDLGGIKSGMITVALGNEIENASVIATLLQIPSVHWTAGDGITMLQGRAWYADTQHVVAMLPVIPQNIQHLILNVFEVTEELLTAIQQHFVASTSLYRLTLDCKSFARGTANQLLPSLHNSTEVVMMHYQLGSNMSYAELIVMCASAPRPVTLRVRNEHTHGWPDNWRQVIENVMQEFGNQNVTLVVSYNCNETYDSTDDPY